MRNIAGLLDCCDCRGVDANKHKYMVFVGEVNLGSDYCKRKKRNRYRIVRDISR
jgi:hypothetical protein